MKSFADNGVNGALEGRPKVVLNCSTINKGGGIQSAVSFIRELIDRRSDAPVEWILCLSKEVYNQLSLFDGYPLRPSDKVFSSSPARDRDTKRELLDLVHQFQADAVFTYFGPSYIKFPVLHVCGVADGWTTHSTWESFQYINPWYNKIKKLMVSLYRLYWFTKAGVWIVEQEAARTGLIKRGRVPETAVHVVANNCAEHYYSESWQPFLEESEKSRFLVFLLLS